MKYSVLIVLAVGCTTVSAPPPVVPRAEIRNFVDPRVGWTATPNPAIDQRFDSAWRFIVAGDFVNARKRLDDIRTRDASYAPADLAEAVIRIREGQPDAARVIVDRILARYPQYIAAQVYEAEIDVAQTRIRSAYDRYREIVAQPNAPPSASARLAELQTRLFDQLYGAAVAAAPEDAVRLLHEALQVSPTATAARLLLVQKLVAMKQFDEARRELDPLLNTSAVDQTEVQEALAEIEVGHGQYEQAIIRYERLARRDSTGRFSHRLEQVKEQFAAANMPPQVMQALEAPAITRANLAVLMYWKVASIRFAQNVPAPPIAIDISETPGRDELIRATALGIYSIDPITRRMNPDAEVNGTAFARYISRILVLRGASCARQAASDQILTACGIAITADELPVSGRTAAAVLEQVDRVVSR